MKKIIDPNKIKISDIILVVTDNKAIIKVQKKLRYGERESRGSNLYICYGR